MWIIILNAEFKKPEEIEIVRNKNQDISRECLANGHSKILKINFN